MGSYLILDGHSLAFRAWFALQDAGMKTSSGQETQAIYGFVSMATKLLGDFKPDGFGVAFDLHGPTFRDEITSDYKAGRPPTPDPLVSQIELIRKFVDVLGAPGVDSVGFEADDVLATLAARLSERGDDVIVVTGDRDAFQVVNDPHVRVLYNRRGVSDYVLYDEAGIVDRTGVTPSQYPLLAALRGDPSDNLPGVPGVGEKTAAKLVNTYGDVDGIFANLAKCTPKLRESLTASEPQVRKNLLLTPVRRDVPLSIDLDALKLSPPDRSGLEQFFAFVEMRTPRDRLFSVLDSIGVGATGAGSGESAAIAKERPVRVIEDATQVVGFLTDLDKATAEQGRITIEVKWAGAPGRTAIEGIAFASDGMEEVVYVLGDHLGEPKVKGALAHLVGSSSRPRFVAHRSKEIMRAWLCEDIDMTELDLDTAVVSYLVDPSQGQVTLEELAARRGRSLRGVSEPAGGQLGFALAEDGPSPVEGVARRAELIADVADVLDGELDEVQGRELYEEIERPLIRVLAKMEVAGIGVDVERLREINAAFTLEARELEEHIHSLAGESFNVNSTTQLRTVLFDKLGLRPQKKTKTGYSTDAQSLEKLRGEHPIIGALLRYREIEKLRSTYGEGLISEVGPDGRIHASFGQTVARTGRLSSDQPNLHNIPVRTEEGRRFREVFVPAPGASLLVADYNQIELRVIAHLTDDPGLVGAFAAGEDIHNTTAARIFGVPNDEVTTQMRSKSKMVSYGLAYGMEVYGLSQRLAIGVDEAAMILDQYFKAFPAVRSYMDETVAQAKARGYTVTERGRRRYLPELTSDNFRVRQSAERQAMNSGIQGLAADIFKIALVNLDGALERENLEARVVLQVHDEVLVEANPNEHEIVEKLTVDAMRNAYPLKVPLEVHVSWGSSWADAK